MDDEEPNARRGLNGSAKLVFVLLGAMFVLVTGFGAAIYTSLNTRLQIAEGEVVRQAATVATLRTQIEYSERDMKSVLNELTQVRGELIAVRLLIAAQQGPQRK